MSARTGVLFVCYANLVRSPLAAAVFAELAARRGLADRFRIDSAGVAADLGNERHPDSVDVAASHGLTLTGTSRPLRRDDLFEFDHVLVLDRRVAAEIQRLLAGARPTAQFRLLATLADPHARDAAQDVRDPISKGPEAFEAAFQQIARACAALLAELSR